MFNKKETGPARAASADAMSRLRQVTAEIDRMFDQGFRWPVFANRRLAKNTTWYPEIDVFERNNRLIAKVDLPGLTKNDVSVEVIDGQLTIAGERRTETENTDTFYRCERAYGSFYRAIPLPEGTPLDHITATFLDGVLEVSVPLPPPAVAPKPKSITIDEPAKKAQPAA